MAYCALADLLKRMTEEALMQLTDKEGTGSVNSERLEEAILSADALIDGHLGDRGVTLPLSPVPVLIKQLSVDLTIWTLFSNRIGEEVPESVKDKYANAIKLLGKMQSGSLGWGTGSTAPNAPEEFQTDVDEEDQVFTKDVLDQY